MTAPTKMHCRTFEILRFGESVDTILNAKKEYLVSTGYDDALRTTVAGIDLKEFRPLLKLLRYPQLNATNVVIEASKKLGDHACSLLGERPPVPDGSLMQLDLVTHAAELCAFPFEALYARYPELLQSPDTGVVLTRRIRSNSSEDSPSWPTKPRILFLHAPKSDDLDEDLIHAHEKALLEALSPWLPDDKQSGKWLQTRCISSAEEIAEEFKAFMPTYVHFLAHGAQSRDEDGDTTGWGLRLGAKGSEPVLSAAIAKGLISGGSKPTVVTLAACDGANDSQPMYSHASVAQELHRQGIPVVVGSQFPLTQSGSVTVTRVFYAQLLQGLDVRSALHAARNALFNPLASTAHDWLGLVGYVRLPPSGYQAHLFEYGLRCELQMLRAAQQRADDLSSEPAKIETFDRIEARLRERIATLDHKRQQLPEDAAVLQDECGGLLGSAYKRLAELHALRANSFSARAVQDRKAAVEALQTSLKWYGDRFRANSNSHWNGVQQLALEAVLTGHVGNRLDWCAALRSAEMDGAKKPKDPWPFGSLMELWLLAAVVEGTANLKPAQAAADEFRRRAESGQFELESTRRQLKRYVTWWTKGNGFFGDRQTDLSADAHLILTRLTP